MSRLNRVLWAAFGPAPADVPERDRLVILVSKNVTRGKAAAGAVHAALYHFDVPHGAVVVLGASPSQIEARCGNQVIRDAGRTEVEPGTITAGIPLPFAAPDSVEGAALALGVDYPSPPQMTGLSTDPALSHLVRRLIRELEDRCEVAMSGKRSGRCPGAAVGVRLEHGFSDVVCDEHALTAEERGATVVRAS